MSSEDITIGIDVEGADEAADAISNVTKAVTGLNDVNLDNLDNASQSLDAVTSSAQQVVDPLDAAKGSLNDIQLIDLSNLDDAAERFNTIGSSAQQAIDPIDQTKEKLNDLGNINLGNLNESAQSMDALGNSARESIDPLGLSRDRMNELGGVSESTSGSFRTFVGSMNNAVTGFSALGVGMLNIISNYTQMERAQLNAERASNRLATAKQVEAQLQEKLNEMIQAGDTTSTKFQQTETALANAHQRVGTQADFAALTQEHANETLARFFTEIVPSGIAVVSGLAQTIATMPQTVNNLKSAFDGLSKALGISDALSAIGPAGRTAADGEYAAAGGATALSGSMGKLVFIIPQVAGLLAGVYGGLKLQQQSGFDASKAWSDFGQKVGDAAPPLQGLAKWLDNANTQMDILIRQGLEKLGIKLPATTTETQKMNDALGKTSGAASKVQEDLGPLGSIVETTGHGFNILADNTKKANEQTRDVPGAYNAAVGTVQRFGDAAILAGGEILETGNKTESAGQLMTNALKNSTDSWNKDAQAITDWTVAHNTPIDVIGKTGTELHDMSLFLAAVTDQEDKSTKKAVDWLARHGEMNLVMDVGIEKAIAYANAHGAQTEKVNESAKSLEEYTKDLQDATEKQNLQTDALLKSVEQGGSAARAMADLAKSYAEALDKSGQLNTKLTDSHAIWDRYNTDILDGRNQFLEFNLKQEDAKIATDTLLANLKAQAAWFGGMPDIIAPTVQNYEDFITANKEGGDAAFEFQQRVSKAWSDLTSAGDSFFSSIIKSMGESGQQGSQDFLKAFQDLPPQVQAILTPSDVQSLAVQAAFAQAGDAAAKAFAEKTQAALGEGFPTGQAEQIGLQAALGILAGVAQTHPQFQSQFDQLWRAITSGQPEQIKAALDNLAKMPGPVAEIAGQLGAAMQPANTAVGQLTNNLTQMGLHWATTGQDIVNQAGQVVGAIDPVTGAFIAAGGGVTQYQQAVQAGQYIWYTFININNQLTYAINQAGQAAVAMNNAFKTGAQDAAGSMNALVHYAVDVWVPSMKSPINEVAFALNTYIKAGADDAAGSLGYGSTGLVGFAKNTWVPEMKVQINEVAVALNRYTARGVDDAIGNFNSLVTWARTVWLPQMRSIIQQGTPPSGSAAGSPTLSGRGTPGAPYAPSAYGGGAPTYYYAQHGFVGIVDKPTAFVVGEAGPEYVSILPGAGASQGGNVLYAQLQDMAAALTKSNAALKQHTDTLTKSDTNLIVTNTTLTTLQTATNLAAKALAGSGLQEAAQNTSTTVNTTNERMGAYNTTLASANERMGIYNTTMGATNAAMGSYSANVGAASDQTASYDTAIGAAAAQTGNYGASVSAASGQVGQYNTTLASANERMGVYNTTMNAGTSALTAMNSSSNTASRGLDSTGTSGNSASRGLDSTGTSAGTAAQGLGSTATNAGAAANSLSGYNYTLGSVNQQSGYYNTTLGSVNEKFGQYNTTLGSANYAAQAAAYQLNAAAQAAANFARQAQAFIQAQGQQTPLGGYQGYGGLPGGQPGIPGFGGSQTPLGGYGGIPARYAQHGFVGVVDRPTAFVAGEAGPEYVSIVPGGGTISSAMMTGLSDTVTSLVSLQKSADLTSHALAGSGLSEAANTTTASLNLLADIEKPLVPALDNAATSAGNIIEPINNLGNAATGAANAMQQIPAQFAYLAQYLQPGYVPPQFGGLAQYGSFPGPQAAPPGGAPTGGGPSQYGPFGYLAQYGSFGGGGGAAVGGAGGGAAYYGGPPAGYGTRPYGPFGGLSQYGQFGGGGSAGGGSAMWYGGPPQGAWSPSPYGSFGAYQQYGQFGGGQQQAQGGPQGNQGGAYQSPQASPAQYGQQQPRMYATGFEGIISQATAFIAGEAGPEFVSIRPFRNPGSATDINSMLEMIAELIRQIKNQAINVNVNSFIDGYSVYKNQQRYQNQRYGTYLG